jgi:hypothetical protein
VNCFTHCLIHVEEEQRKQIALCAKKLDGLMDMRATGEISETEYRTRKAAIFAEKEQLESSTTGTSDSEWITTAKRGFDFARAACIAFKQDDSLGLELRKEIMSTIGSNHELVGKKVTLKADILIEAIEKLAESASEILRVFEPKENGSNAGRNGAVVRPSSYLLPLLDKFRTANWKRIKSELQFSGILDLFQSPVLQN